MYLLLVHCLFERFVNMYLFSMFVNNHICCALVLFGTNCPYECRNNSNVCYQTCDILPFCNHFFSCCEITCVWGIEPLLIYRFLQQLTILYNKVWKDNWTYWDTCQYYILYCSIDAIWVHFKRNYNLFDQVLINVITFALFSLYLNGS